MEEVPLRAYQSPEINKEDETSPSEHFLKSIPSNSVWLVIFLLYGSLFVLPIAIYPNMKAGSGTACFDGNFRIAKISSPFDVRTIFAINLGFGSFRFAVAKGIDVAFDLIIGRGGQLLLAFISYPVFTNTLLYTMETHPASYSYFAAIAFETFSLSTMFQISKRFGRQRNRRDVRSILIPLGLLLASLFILAFPTLASAATGYSTSQEPYVTLSDDATSRWQDFALCDYVIEDGGRVEDLKNFTCLTFGDQMYNETKDYFQLLDNETLNKDSTSRLGNFSLPAPPLSIKQQSGYHLNDTFFSNVDLEGGVGFCKPVSNSYKWGFSYLMLVIIVILTYVWTAILLALHIDTERNSQLARYRRRLGLYRAVLDFSKAIRQELGEDAQLLPNAALEKQLVQAKDGIRYQVPVDTETLRSGAATA